MIEGRDAARSKAAPYRAGNIAPKEAIVLYHSAYVFLTAAAVYGCALVYVLAVL